MKNRTILLTFLSLLSFSTLAQEDFNGSIKWGEPFNVSKREYGPTPIGVAGTNFYATSSVKQIEYINSFDLESMSFENKGKLSFVDGKNKLTKKSSMIFGDDVLYITSYVDKAAKKEHFLLHKIQDNLMLGEGIELVALDWEKTPKIVMTQKALDKKLGATNAFSAMASSDNKSLLVFYSESMKTTEYTTIMFDENLEELGREQMVLPYAAYATISVQFSNDGRYYMLGYETTEEESTGLIKRTIKGKGDYHVLVYDPMTGSMEDFTLNLDKNIQSSAIRVMDDGSIYIYGMYSEEDAVGVSGAFFEKYSNSYDLIFSEVTEFEADFITQHWSEKEKKKAEKKEERNPEKAKEPALYNYIMHGLAVKDNGDVVLIAEQYYMYVTSHTTYVNGRAQTTYTYHYIYNDVVTVNCTSEGEITWKNLIKKRQHSINDGGYYSSFYTAVDGNEVIFVYNDKEANLDDAEETTSRKEKKQAERNTVAAFIRLSEDGEFDRRTLFDFEGDDSRTLVPKLCRKLGENEFLLYTNAPKRGKILGRVTFE